MSLVGCRLLENKPKTGIARWHGRAVSSLLRKPHSAIVDVPVCTLDFLLLRQCLTAYPRLAWDWLYRPGWLPTQNSPLVPPKHEDESCTPSYPTVICLSSIKFIYIGHTNWSKMKSQSSFNLHSLIAKDVTHFKNYFSAICIPLRTLCSFML